MATSTNYWCAGAIRKITNSGSRRQQSAGEYPLSEGGVAIQGKNSRGYSLVLTDSAAYTMQFTGSSGDVFSFHLAGTGCGLIGPNAIAEHNGTVIWLCQHREFSFLQRRRSATHGLHADPRHVR